MSFNTVRIDHDRYSTAVWMVHSPRKAVTLVVQDGATDSTSDAPHSFERHLDIAVYAQGHGTETKPWDFWWAYCHPKGAGAQVSAAA